MTLQLEWTIAAEPKTGFLAVQSVSGWKIKTYGIAPGRPRTALLAAAQRQAARALPQRPDLEGAYGVGFLTVHDTVDCNVALLHWWVRPDELYQRAFIAPPDQPATLEPFIGGTIGRCPELEIIEHERRAWQRHVLSRPGAPNLDAYLTDTLHC